jgi:hypothetical protein
MLRSAVERRRGALVQERQRMREQMERQQNALSAGWLHGIDDLSPGSFDLLTITIYYPA